VTAPWYIVLGVSPDASAKEVKKSYRRLAKKYHPDRNSGDPQAEAKFKEVNQAYEEFEEEQEESKSKQQAKQGQAQEVTPYNRSAAPSVSTKHQRTVPNPFVSGLAFLVWLGLFSSCLALAIFSLPTGYSLTEGLGSNSYSNPSLGKGLLQIVIPLASLLGMVIGAVGAIGLLILLMVGLLARDSR